MFIDNSISSGLAIQQQVARMGYLNTYYVANILLILLYPIHKFLNLNSNILNRQDSFGFTYENSIIYTMLTLLSLNYIRSYSLPQFISEALVLLKIMVFCFYTFINFNYAIIYVCVCLVVWVFVSYPKYTGPNKFVRIKSIEEFQTLIEGDVLPQKTKKAKKRYEQEAKVLPYENKKMWFVEFYVDWAPNCLHAKEIWAEYSMRYTTERLRFATVNLDKVKDISVKFSINTSGFSRQLPTVIMFEDGEEVLRFPPIDSKTKKVSKVLKYESKILGKYFDMEQRYLQTRQYKPST